MLEHVTYREVQGLSWPRCQIREVLQSPERLQSQRVTQQELTLPTAHLPERKTLPIREEGQKCRVILMAMAGRVYCGVGTSSV